MTGSSTNSGARVSTACDNRSVDLSNSAHFLERYKTTNVPLPPVEIAISALWTILGALACGSRVR